MAAPVIAPEVQFSDANGTPYAGGTVETYVPGTSTPKATWLDPELSALNTNPVVLDAAGRCVMWGDGDYRLVLRDALGNEIWDREGTTLISAAMAPVVAAPTIADALELLGVTDLIATEAATRAFNDGIETTNRENQDAALSDYIIAADEVLQANIDAETARATAAEAALASSGFAGQIQYGNSVTDSDGHKRVTFAAAFGTTPTVVASINGTTYDVNVATINTDNTGFDVWFAFPLSVPTPAGSRVFYWIAIGTAPG